MDNGACSYRRFCEDGDEGGLVEIIRNYKDGLIFYLNSFVGNILIAEELTEDTFIRLGTKKPRDKDTGSFKTWLYTIGRHVAINYLRRHAKTREILLEYAPELNAQTESLVAAYIRAGAKDSCPPGHGTAFPRLSSGALAGYFEDFTVKETAAIMKKRVHAVETLLYRAKKALKTQLETEGFLYGKL